MNDNNKSDNIAAEQQNDQQQMNDSVSNEEQVNLNTSGKPTRTLSQKLINFLIQAGDGVSIFGYPVVLLNI
jgi:hypothetical protein